MVIILSMQLLMMRLLPWCYISPPTRTNYSWKKKCSKNWAHTAEWKINDRSFYDILDQICMDTNLYSFVKQHESKRDERGAYYHIYSRWLSPNHFDATASEAEMALQTSRYDDKKKAWNWEKFVAWHVKCHIILGNIMEYGYQGHDQASKNQYLLNGIRCDK